MDASLPTAKLVLLPMAFLRYEFHCTLHPGKIQDFLSAALGASYISGSFTCCTIFFPAVWVFENSLDMHVVVV